MKTLITIGFFLLSIITQAQDHTWSGAISHLVYDNCSSCHHDGGIAPFNLMSYEDVAAVSNDMHHAVTEREMPPWPADPNYMHFANEAYLSDAEIEAIQWWLENDMPMGDADQAPEPPTFPESGSLLETIDFSLEIEPYTLQSNTDEFRWFVFENPFDEDIYISKLEVIPGLENVVHHADLFYDLTGTSMNYDNLDPQSGFGGSTGYPVNSYYINAWQPGGNIAEYPENWGIRVPPNADLVIEIHYGPGGLGQIDETKMNLQFLTNTQDAREVRAAWLMGHSAPTLIDGPLVIPANEEAIFHQVTAPLTSDISVISICPHMHFIGKSYKVWYTDPDGVDHPLIDIPRWDLHWQKYYMYQTIKHIPAGSVLKSEGVYDNTVNNHDNPFDPPQTVSLGNGTFDEMFLCYFIYADYEPGDEDIIMDPDLITDLTELNINTSKEKGILIYPNPSKSNLTVVMPTDINGQIEIEIFNTLGEIVGTHIFTTTENKHSKDIDISRLDPGNYSLAVSTLSDFSVIKFIKE